MFLIIQELLSAFRKYNQNIVGIAKQNNNVKLCDGLKFLIFKN